MKALTLPALAVLGTAIGVYLAAPAYALPQTDHSSTASKATLRKEKKEMTAKVVQADNSAAAGPSALVKSGYAPVNGLKMYYEIHGNGEPLILLHGGVGATEMFGEILPSLSSIRRVIAVDLQAHGRTADIDRPLSYEAMADDIAALTKYLGIEKADVMGYSLGVVVALRTAVQHPDLVRKLVLVSTPFSRDGWYPEIRAAMAQSGAGTAEQMKQTPMYQLYARIAPRPADWPVLFTKLGDLLRKDYDWSKDVAASRRPLCSCLVMPTPFAPHMPWSSSSSWVAARRTPVGTARGCPIPGSLFCRA